MKIHRAIIPSEFLISQQKFLMQNEAENNLLLGISLSLVQNPEHLKLGSYLATVQENGEVIGVALYIPPQKLVLSRMPADAVELLAQDLKKNQIFPEGIVAPSEVADRFAKIWSELNPLSIEPGLMLTFYRLGKLQPIALAAGQMRRAWLEDLPLIETWSQAFVNETRLKEDPKETKSIARKTIESRRLFVWDHKGIVAMAGFSGNTPNGVRINMVYTPPEHRGQKYAQSCVVKLNELLLQTGKKTSFLFCERANPMTNHLYQKIGYEALLEFNEYYFSTLLS
jgi:predicted GNAT family acetyltransferase